MLKDALESGESDTRSGAFAKVRDFLDPHFDRIDRGIEWVNIPPCTLFWAWKD